MMQREAGVAKGTERKLPLLSRGDVERLKGKIAGDEAYLKQLEKAPDDLEGAAREAHLPAGQVIEVDTGAVNARIRRTKKALDLLDPANQRLTGAERQHGEKRDFHLKAILADRMLPHQEVDYFPSSTDAIKDQNYQRAVTKACDFKNGEHSPGFAKDAQEFKRLAKLLWPEDPEMCNVNTIRGHSGPSGRKFRR